MILNKTIKGRIVVSGVVIVIAACAMITLFASKNMLSLAEQSSKESLEALANQYAENIEKELGAAVITAQTLTASLEGVQASGDYTPENIAQMTIGVVAANPQYVGCTAAWEPNKFNGNDQSLIGNKYADATGRYVPYFYNTKDGVAFEALDMSPEAGIDEWYLRPIKENREVVTPPYLYPVEGVDVLMTTVSVPIHDKNNNAIGIVTVDTSLDKIGEIVSKIKPYKNGFAYLISHDGQWVAHPDKKMPGTPIKGDLEKTIFDHVIKDGFFHNETLIDGTEMISVAVPVNFGTKENWTLAIHAKHDDVFAQSSQVQNILLMISLLCVVVATLVYYFMGSSVAKPITQLATTMGTMADGQTDIEIQHQDKQDEIGSMAKALHHFQERLQENIALQKQAHEMEIKASQERHDSRIALADDFERSVNSIATEVSNGIQEASGSAAVMSDNSQASRDKMSLVVHSIQDANRNVQTVAASAEELSASIVEISSRVAEVANTAKDASNQVEQTNATVGDLSSSAERIGQVVNLINEIADQTNMLALNATIEAARAGEAGKGFAVVASEVKNLANQTAKATSEIFQQVTDMQDATRKSVQAIQGIKTVIDQVDQITTGIASAVEEQAAATSEIARGAQNASNSTIQVEQAVSEVAGEVENVNEASTTLTQGMEDLKQRSHAMSQEVETFLNGIRHN
ncbi:methyl-accepting chemotaxis protein [Terasakiella pusilla]|uniref:methyl-accepting chemotaxis protein n=1 Tax=Terasakiella pusilla TaxID=64973 RepID=UPI00048B3243|nr:methyl-accepting chemotaxis protein [Terasakiella pusilla]